MLKTFSDVQRRFETLRERFEKRGYHVETLVLEPPITWSILMEREVLWKHSLPDEIRGFFTKVAGRITFDWTDETYMDSCSDGTSGRSICSEPIVSELYQPCWPVSSCDCDFSLDRMDWLFGNAPGSLDSFSYWAEVEECWNDAEHYDSVSPYEYRCSTPFIKGSGGELFVYYDPPSGDSLIYHSGDTELPPWHKIANSFHSFLDHWSLLGCPAAYEIFYDQQKQCIDPYGVNAICWRKFLEIDNL